jgi:hypothetical protein
MMIRLDVKLIPQDNLANCWYAGLAMVFGYFEDMDCNEILLRNAFVQKLVDDYEGLGNANVYKIRHQFGDKGKRKLRKMPKTINRNSLGTLELGQLLTQFGPLYCGGWFGGAAGKGGRQVGAYPHAIVITGVDAATDTVYYNDPWPVRGGWLDKTMTIAEFVENLDWDARAEAGTDVEEGKHVGRCWMLHYSVEKDKPIERVKVLSGEALQAREAARIQFIEEIVDNNRWAYGRM